VLLPPVDCCYFNICSCCRCHPRYALPVLTPQDHAVGGRLIVTILFYFFCRCHHSLRGADADTARCCCCHRRWLIVLIEYSVAVSVTARCALPTRIPKDDAAGGYLIITILVFFAVAITTCYAVSMLMLRDVAVAIAAG